MGFEFHRNRLHEVTMNFAERVAYGTPLFKGWVYVVASLGLLLLALRMRAIDHPAVLALAGSSLMYTAASFLVGVDCAFRYNWWLVIATMTLLLLIVGAWVKNAGIIGNRR
jgi:hypothetical protein